MNIAIINECKKYGGAEVYVQKLKEILIGNGHKVLCIYLHANEEMDNDEFNLRLTQSIIAKFLYSYRKINKIRELFIKNKVDMIIINNVFSEPMNLYRAVRGYRVLQILHDYSVICPKSTCITDAGDICEGYKNESCIEKCKYRNSTVKLIVKLFLMKLIDINRKNVVSGFISPSKRLAEMARKNSYHAIDVANPVSFKLGGVKQKYKNRYVYVGGVNRGKGLYDMLPAFKRFASDRDVTLHIYGKLSLKEDEIFLKKYCSDKIIYKGVVEHDDIPSIISEAYALLVPSFGMENYPTTVLEGFVNRTVVIGSDRGGIPEMLSGGRGICYQYGQEYLLDALEKSMNISDEEYDRIVERGIQYVNENNTDKIYYEKLMRIIDGL